MLERLLDYGLQYTIYTLEVVLFVSLLRRGQWKRQLGVAVYVISLLTVDALVRPYFLYHYGLKSDPFGYCYWLSDVVLALEAFGLLCIFFRRACSEKMWHLLRLWLAMVFVGIALVSYIKISRNYTHFTQRSFIYEFEQYLFFACLVLTTLLFIMLQQAESTDDQLELLVCGMGIQFAGPTASLALVHVTLGWQSDYWQFASSLLHHIAPLCSFGTLLIWIYAVRRFPTLGGDYRASADHRRVPALAGVGIRTD
jgi:hypothetical protein